MQDFTVEETNLICVFNTSDRHRLIEDLNASLPDTEDDPEMTELTKNVLDKLGKMTDAEFAALDLIPADDQEEMED